MLISRGDAIVAIAMSIEADQFVISIPPPIAVAVMKVIGNLNPRHYLDKGADDIMVAEGENIETALDAMHMYQDVFAGNTISSVAVLPLGTMPKAVLAALAEGAPVVPLDDPPKLILLTPSNDDPEVSLVVELVLEALKAAAPERAAYLLDGAQAYREKYGHG